MSHPKSPLQRETLEVPIGATCNNECRFCSETRRGRVREDVARMNPDAVRQFLIQHRAMRDVIFGFGEPTLNPHLVEYVALAHELGYESIGVISNGRRLTDRALLRSGRPDEAAEHLAKAVKLRMSAKEKEDFEELKKEFKLKLN